MNTPANPARRITASALREARLSWRLSRLGATLAALDPLLEMIDAAESSPGCSVAGGAKETGQPKPWRTRGAVRLAASAAYLLGRDEALERMLRLGARRYGEDATLLHLEARRAVDDGRLDDAASLARRAAAIAPDRPRLRQLLARLEARAGRHDAAIEAARAAIRLRPRRACLRVELAQIALAAGRHDLGLKAIGALIDPPALLHARLLAGCGRWREAVEMYDRVLESHAPAPSSQSRSPLAAAPIRVTCFNRGVDVDRDLVDAAIERIDLLERLGDRSAVIALADAEVADPFRHPALLVRLAEVMLNFGEARRCVALAGLCRHSAEAPRALALISVAADLLGRGVLAERCRRRLRAGDRTLLARSWRRGLMARLIAAQTSCRRAGSDPTQSVLEPLLTRAVEVLTDASAQSPRYADVHYHRANCLAALGRTEEAAAALDTALRINPSYADARRLADTLRAAA